LEFQAAELSKPFVGLTKAMKDTVEVFQKELQVITKVPELQAQARGVRGSGFGGLNPLYVPGTPEFIANQLNELLYKRVAYTATPGRGGDEIREQINKQITDIFAKAAPSVQRELLQRSDFKEIIAQSYEGQAGFVKDQVDYQRQLNEQSSSKVREAQTLLQELNRLGGGNESERLTRLVQGLPVAALSGEEQKLSPAELQGRKDTIRQRYLDIVGGLSREELTPDLVKGIPPELREQARFTRDREQRAKDAVGATENLQKSMETYLNKMLDSIKARNDKVLIEVTDKTTSAQVHTLGQSFE
jgi:gas vesicle protein